MTYSLPESTLTQLEQRENLHLARVLAARTLREQGLSLRVIGSALGLSHEKVRQLLRESAVNK